jgi:hypothetical protein
MEREAEATKQMLAELEANKANASHGRSVGRRNNGLASTVAAAAAQVDVIMKYAPAVGSAASVTECGSWSTSASAASGSVYVPVTQRSTTTLGSLSVTENDAHSGGSSHIYTSLVTATSRSFAPSEVSAAHLLPAEQDGDPSGVQVQAGEDPVAQLDMEPSPPASPRAAQLKAMEQHMAMSKTVAAQALAAADEALSAGWAQPAQEASLSDGRNGVLVSESGMEQSGRPEHGPLDGSGAKQVGAHEHTLPAGAKGESTEAVRVSPRAEARRLSAPDPQMLPWRAQVVLSRTSAHSPADSEDDLEPRAPPNAAGAGRPTGTCDAAHWKHKDGAAVARRRPSPVTAVDVFEPLPFQPSSALE